MDPWRDRLRPDHPEQAVAIEELRELLLRALQKRFSGRVGQDQAFLEDIVQDSLLKILQSLDRFQGHSRFSSWALSIAIRVAFNELRRKDWRQVSLEDLSAQKRRDVEPDALDPGPEFELDRRELVQTLRRVIETTLTARQREVLLCELSGMPQEEIARQLGTNRNNVYKLFHDARIALKRELESRGLNRQNLLGLEKDSTTGDEKS